MKRSRSLDHVLVPLAVVLPLVLLASERAARADIAPSCDVEASLITCAAADVGKPCQGGGFCYAVDCFATGTTTNTTLYKCDACPTVVTATDAGCQPPNLGTACGDGGTCGVLSAWCATNVNKYACSVPPAARPTGPPTGETGAAGAGGAGGTSSTGVAGSSASSATGTGGGAPSSSGGGGCTVGAGAETTAGIAGGLIVIGLGFLSLSGRRRAR